MQAAQLARAQLLRRQLRMRVYLDQDRRAAALNVVRITHLDHLPHRPSDVGMLIARAGGLRRIEAWCAQKISISIPWSRLLSIVV